MAAMRGFKIKDSITKISKNKNSQSAMSNNEQGINLDLLSDKEIDIKFESMLVC